MRVLSLRVRSVVAGFVAAVVAGVGLPAPAVAAEWSGSFTGAFAVNPFPVLGEATSVSFTVSPSLSQAQVRVFDGAGALLKSCSTGSGCSVSSNPAPGASLSYRAEVWAYRAGVLTLVEASPVVTVTDPGWTGGFTAAYAANPFPVLGQSTSVWFEVSAPLSQAQVRVFDQDGAQVKMCHTGLSCSITSNPGPGYTLSYRAELWAYRDGTLVQLSTSPVVAVADPGWTGQFSDVYAANPFPVGAASTGVFFQVTPQLSAGTITVYDHAGTYVTTCYAGPSCSITVNPAPGTSRGYHAQIWVLRGAQSVLYATSPTVVVTDPGWTGQFTSATTTAADQAFWGATSATFTWDQPLQYAWIDIVNSTGEVVGTCDTTGTLSCSAALALGPDETGTLHAQARVPGPGGTGHVTIATSSAVQLAGMDANAFAHFLLTAPEASLVPLLGSIRTEQALQTRTKQLSLEFCLALGQRYPSHKLHSTVPDLTLLCNAGKVGLLAWMIVEMGVDGALDMLSSTDDGPGPQPQPDPPGGGAGGGDDPPPAVDTCQLPSGPDPEIFYFYQRTDQMLSIEETGWRQTGSQGKIWFTNVLYGSGAEAQANLSMPYEPPTGYYELPRDRLEDLFGPYCVDPYFGQPGGGIEYWTTQPIDMRGLEWHPFP